MFNAKEAKAQSAENKIKTALYDLEKDIKKAVAKGKGGITHLCAYDLIDDLTEALQTAGYKVDKVQGGLKVQWG